MRLLGRYWTFRELMTSPFGPIVLAIAGIGGYYLWTAHQAHVIDALPYLLLGGCLVMHLFMHRGRGHGHGGVGHSHGSHQTMASPHEEVSGAGSEDSRRS